MGESWDGVPILDSPISPSFLVAEDLPHSFLCKTTALTDGKWEFCLSPTLTATAASAEACREAEKSGRNSPTPHFSLSPSDVMAEADLPRLRRNADSARGM